MKKNDLIILIVFLLFLYLPSIAYFICYEKTDQTVYENRELYNVPKLTLKTLETFPKNYENYYNDHVPFKNEIRKLRSYIFLNLFKTSSNQKVIYGKNGWLFYNSSNTYNGNTILDYRNTTELKTSDQEAIINNMTSVSENFKKKNIDFYLYIIPNKENVYSSLMPSIINRSNREKSRTELLIDKITKETNVNVVYPKDVLTDFKKVQETYYKYDSHYNSYGAYISTMKLMEKIEPEFQSQEIDISFKNESGDLSKMLMLNLENSEPNVTGFFDDIKSECKKVGNNIDNCSSKGMYDKTILFIGDSFIPGAKIYLSKIFKNSIFVHRDSYNENFIDKYKPDIVIYEAVERSIYTLKNNIYK